MDVHAHGHTQLTVQGLLAVSRSPAIVSKRTGSPTSLNPERVPGVRILTARGLAFEQIAS